MQWMYDDSPRTPKILIADAESGKLTTSVLHHEKEALKTHMQVYSVSLQRKPLVGLLLGEELILDAFTLNAARDLVLFTPLNEVDLSDVNGILRAMMAIN